MYLYYKGHLNHFTLVVQKVSHTCVADVEWDAVLSLTDIPKVYSVIKLTNHVIICSIYSGVMNNVKVQDVTKLIMCNESCG